MTDNADIQVHGFRKIVEAGSKTVIGFIIEKNPPLPNSFVDMIDDLLGEPYQEDEKVRVYQLVHKEEGWRPKVDELFGAIQWRSEQTGYRFKIQLSEHPVVVPFFDREGTSLDLYNYTEVSKLLKAYDIHRELQPKVKGTSTTRDTKKSKGFQQITYENWDVIDASTLTQPEKMTLITILRCCSGKRWNWCEEWQSVLAQRASCHPRTLKRTLDRLKSQHGDEKPWIKVETPHMRKTKITVLRIEVLPPEEFRFKGGKGGHRV